MQGKMGDSSHTRTIKSFITRIQEQSIVKDSLYESAIHYFENLPEQDKKIGFAEAQISDAQDALDQCENVGKKAQLEDKVQKLKSHLIDIQKEIDADRLVRLEKANQLAMDIMHEIQGKSPAEMDINVARFLGTLLLVSPTEGKQIAKINQKHKHLYKAVLTIKLMHHLVEQNALRHDFVKKKYQQHQKFLIDKGYEAIDESPFRRDVEIPVVIAALCQDIGQFHQDAQLILKGEEGDLDEFRMLDKDDRNNLLKINYTQTLKFVTHGLGMDRYRGNSKEEKVEFQQNEKDKLTFVRDLLKQSVNPGDGIGNLLKVPQVYCSVVLSTKANYAYDALPRVNVVMEKGAEVGAYNKKVSQTLMSILGIFPQGFGIAYIPKDGDGFDLDRYEYAIVNKLYPPSIETPICRVVTRGLTFNTVSINNVISKGNNLFYHNTRNKLEKMSKQRLQEILMSLSSNFEERRNQDLIPACWHPHDFFGTPRAQNLWNKADTQKN